jgi:hypothetical protein
MPAKHVKAEKKCDGILSKVREREREQKKYHKSMFRMVESTHTSSSLPEK